MPEQELERLRSVFATPLVVAPGQGVGGQGLMESAVLIGCRPRPAGVQLVLTRRSERLLHHAGQISFPGGRCEEGDLNATGTALREAHEEVGLDPAAVEVLGELPAFATPSGFRITPVVGILAADARLQASPDEVAEIFWLPLAVICKEANFQRHRIRSASGERSVRALPYAGRFIWGATAGILYSLGQCLTARR